MSWDILVVISMVVKQSEKIYAWRHASLDLYCRFGRKMSLTVFLSIRTVGNALAIFADDYVTFAVGRFICGVGGVGAALTAFVMGACCFRLLLVILQLIVCV